ncbi:MAG: hypothetical protein ACYDHE_06355 [Candidatus Acidiferrales bacterium]
MRSAIPWWLRDARTPTSIKLSNQNRYSLVASLARAQRRWSVIGVPKRYAPMAKYLLVAHQTAERQELLDAVLDLAARDAQTEFTLLVPATHIGHLPTLEEGEVKELAQYRVRSAAASLSRNDIKVVEAKAGERIRSWPSKTSSWRSGDTKRSSSRPCRLACRDGFGWTWSTGCSDGTRVCA